MSAAGPAVGGTIFALSSGAPPTGIAIVRISGISARAAAESLCGPIPRPRQATYRPFRDSARDIIDRGLLIWFPGPDTATGEDVAELHLHGGRAVVARVLAVLAELPDLRAAGAGEFTRRAFLNGRIDLLEAEALGDLLSAETEQQRRAALHMADGALSKKVDGWRRTALHLAAAVEASLDFGDEDDDAAGSVDVSGGAAELASSIRNTLSSLPAERLRDGIRVVLAGPPNAGKSSLLNHLVGRDAAIISPVAGTTRDVIEVPVAIGGVAFLFADTAGLRDHVDPVEQIGIARARHRISSADLLLWLGDDPPSAALTTLWLYPRADVRADAPQGRLAVSVRTGDGTGAVVQWLLARAQSLLPAIDTIALSRRQRSELVTAEAAAREAASEQHVVLQAEALRRVLHAFDRLTGRAGFEDLLDTVFSSFCIGK